ncbi:hypothetical protein HMPREF0299_6113 [Corynebacterium matruchotii ATCC 14266]|uniref:Uncharacterized protein n=1 Tax=Corynebacterium matruchotii ATCC 14266 TaxID=553207 RepID=E0DCR2_9CORY|nr:hypothetical protein HMPREF0299_6113 [Corynebacterium matruchotii ATCC 14266]
MIITSVSHNYFQPNIDICYKLAERMQQKNNHSPPNIDYP